MKKTFITACAVVLALSSCITTTKTAKTADLPVALYSATVSDLDVSPNRITKEYKPTNEVIRGGLTNVKRAAIREALGNEYDVLVEPEFVIDMKNNFFTKKVTKVIVSGRPAKYKNFHSLNDNVWTNEIFRKGYKNGIDK